MVAEIDIAEFNKAIDGGHADAGGVVFWGFDWRIDHVAQAFEGECRFLDALPHACHPQQGRGDIACDHPECNQFTQGKIARKH